VRSIAFDPSNEWFATGSADRTIKIWDLAKCCAGAEGGLKLTLTGHISSVRGLAVSSRHPYLFSAGEDKMVKCTSLSVLFPLTLPGWDLEYNKVVRHYHGHLSGVFDLKIHPTLDLIVTGGRDSVARVANSLRNALTFF
jgi:pleiotropic regulator 1